MPQSRAPVSADRTVKRWHDRAALQHRICVASTGSAPCVNHLMCLCWSHAVWQDSSGRWNQFTGRYAWDTSCICSGNPAYGGTGSQKQGSDFEAAPNVDHSSERVRRVRLCSVRQRSRAHSQGGCTHSLRRSSLAHLVAGRGVCPCKTQRPTLLAPQTDPRIAGPVGAADLDALQPGF